MTDRDPVAIEANFDSIVGNTHNYAGLSRGNIASARNAKARSYPRLAALQGLAKMKHLSDLGLLQGFLPPHERPHVPTLRGLGFEGTPGEILAKVSKEAPQLLGMVSSASPMWAANAATVSPSADTRDGRVHFTPANLGSMPHRALEHEVTGRLLKAVFADEARFRHHPALPGAAHLGDEGAANHNRFCGQYGEQGVAVYVYGRTIGETSATQQHPARQVLEASEAVARSHGLDSGGALFLRQSPGAIDAGAFHNDVVAVANRNVFFMHEQAFDDAEPVFESLRRHVDAFDVISLSASEVSLEDVITSYCFNSQLVDIPGRDGMTLILPAESRENERVLQALERVREAPGAINHLEFVDVRQSMRNGGGPACLRLRVVLTEAEQEAVNPAFLMTEARHKALCSWVEKHYREELTGADLADPALVEETYRALDELTSMLGMGAVYDFQRG